MGGFYFYVFICLLFEEYLAIFSPFSRLTFESVVTLTVQKLFNLLLSTCCYCFLCIWNCVQKVLTYTNDLNNVTSFISQHIKCFCFNVQICNPLKFYFSEIYGSIFNFLHVNKYFPHHLLKRPCFVGDQIGKLRSNWILCEHQREECEHADMLQGLGIS